MLTGRKLNRRKLRIYIPDSEFESALAEKKAEPLLRVNAPDTTDSESDFDSESESESESDSESESLPQTSTLDLNLHGKQEQEIKSQLPGASANKPEELSFEKVIKNIELQINELKTHSTVAEVTLALAAKLRTLQKAFANAIKYIELKIKELKTHSIVATVTDLLALATMLRALQNAKENFKEQTVEVDGLDRGQRENILSNVEERLALHLEFFANFKEYVIKMLGGSYQGPEVRSNSIFLSSREFVYLNLRHLIGFDDKEAELAFDTLWLQLKQTLSQDLAAIVFASQENPQKNQLLQQVPALYCLAYKMELQLVLDGFFKEVQTCNEQLEFVVKSEREITDEITELSRQLRYHVKLGELYTAYKLLQDKEGKLNNLILSRSEIIAEAKTDDLDAMLAELRKSKETLLKDALNDCPLEDAQCIDRSYEELFNKYFSRLLTEVKKFQNAYQDIMQCMPVAAALQLRFNHLQAVKFPTKDKVVSAGVGLSAEFDKYWQGIVAELFCAQEASGNSFLQLQQQTEAIIQQRQKQDAEISAKMKQFVAIVQPVALSGEVKEVKKEYEVKGQLQESEGAVAKPQDDAAALSQAVIYVESLLPTKEALRHARAADEFIDLSAASSQTLSWYKSALIEKVERISSRLSDDITRLKTRNTLLILNRDLRPQKPSGKPWKASGISLGMVLVASLCVAFTLSNPFGWGAGLLTLGVLGVCAALKISHHLFSRGGELEKRKKLLEANGKSEPLQAVLEKQDAELAKQSNCLQKSTTQAVRDRLMEEGMIVDSVYPEMFLSWSVCNKQVERCAIVREVRARDVSNQCFWYTKGSSTIELLPPVSEASIEELKSQPNRNSFLAHLRGISSNIPSTSAGLEEELLSASSPALSN